jgi:hypothetical protein
MNNFELITVPGDKALTELNRLRTNFPSSGQYPIILGNSEEMDRVLEFAEEGDDPSEILKFSQTIDAEEWLQKRKELDPDMYSFDEGDWPRQGEKISIITHLDILTQKPLNKVSIALLKISASWEAFANLNWGAWNDCPEPAVHCAIHKQWASQYGSEVVSITGDVVQCVVARPPTSRAASMKLAYEQFYYCSDIVAQGTQTITALAAGLMDGQYWYFWWD